MGIGFYQMQKLASNKKENAFRSIIVEHKLPFTLAFGALSALLLFVLWNLFFSTMTGGLAILYKCGFFFALAFCIASVIIFRKDIVDHPEKPFLVILLAVTCLSSWAYDTNEVSWDLESHFSFMLEYSDASRIHNLTEADDGIRSRALNREHVDQSSLAIIDQAAESPNGAITFETITILLDIEALQTKDALLNQLDSIPDDENKELYGSLSNIYARIASIPASFIYGICSLFGFSFAVKFILAKLLYAFIYSFVLYFGMKKLKSGKLLFAIISLYPTAVFLAANYSYDYWVNAWCMYSIAGIVGQLQAPQEHVRTRDMVGILAGFFIGLAPKAIYFPLILLIFLIPKTKFDSTKTCIVFRLIGSLVALLVLMSFFLPVFVIQGLLHGAMGKGDTRGGESVDSGSQIAFILANPLAYARICFEYLLSYLSITNSQSYIASFAYLGIGPEVVWNTILVTTGFVTITDTRFDTPLMRKWTTRLFVYLLVLGTLILAMTALYISFTPVGHYTINGFQGRYILPLLFPFLAFISIKGLSWPKQEKALHVYSTSILLLMAACNLFMIWTMYVGLLF